MSEEETAKLLAENKQMLAALGMGKDSDKSEDQKWLSMYPGWADVRAITHPKTIKLPVTAAPHSTARADIRFTLLLDDVMRSEGGMWPTLAAKVERWNRVTCELWTVDTAMARVFWNQDEVKTARLQWDLGRKEEDHAQMLRERRVLLQQQLDEKYLENQRVSDFSAPLAVEFREWLAGRKAFHAMVAKCDWRGIWSKIKKATNFEFPLPLPKDYTISKEHADALSLAFPHRDGCEVSPTVSRARKAAGRKGAKASPMSKRPDETELRKKK